MDNNEQLAPSVIPGVRYEDAPAAIEWLEKAFGLEATFVVPGPNSTIAHSQLTYGDGMVMVGSAVKDTEYAKAAADVGPASIYVIVDDPDAHQQRAVAAGAEVVVPMKDEDYGSRGYTARDPEGNIWSFGTYRPKLSGE
jgi:uncharacterized glyoxalase superfamily protein PhnB